MPKIEKKIAGIILAAGTGSRMGKTKQLLPFGPTTLLGQVITAAKASALDAVVVVLGHDAEKIQENTDLSGTRIVTNPNYANGQATSLCAGLAAMDREYGGAMFLLADQPLVDPVIINTLIGAWRQSDRQILIPYCNGKRGNPVIVGASLFKAACTITGDRGARALFTEYPDEIEKINIANPAILTDVDTKEGYDRLLSGNHAL